MGSLPLVANFQRIDELESQRRLRRKLDVPVAGEPCATRAGCCTDQPANNCAFAAAGQATDHRAAACASANHRGCALTFALAGFCGGGGVHLVICSIDLDAGQCELERGATLEAACRLGIFHNTGSARALANGRFAIDFDGLADGGREVLTWRADL